MKLCGDIRSENPYMTPKHVGEFLDKLSGLMEEYRINKIDVCWSRYDGLVTASFAINTDEFTALRTSTLKKGFETK